MAQARLVDVARAANVSAGAVWRALSNDPTLSIAPETRRRILVAVKDLGYVSDARARQLRSGVSTIFGVLVRDLGSAYASQFFHHFSLEIAEMGREVLLGVHTGDMRLAKDHMDRFRAYRTFGVLTVVHPGEPAEWTAALSKEAQNGCGPALTVNFGGHAAARPSLAIDYDWVCDQFFRMARADHRRVAALAMRRGGPLTEAFRKARADSAMHREPFNVASGDPGVVAGEIVPRLVELRRLGTVAVMTSVDTDAIVITQQLLKRGLSVPQDVAVLGYGNLYAAQLSSPAISTVDVSGTVPAMARKVIALLKTMEESKTLEEKEYPFRPAVIVRESFRPPPGWESAGSV